MARVGRWGVALALLASSVAAPGAVARAEDGISSRRLGVVWRGSVPHLSFSARDLVSVDVRRKLESGLPQTIQVGIYAYRSGETAVLAASARSCRITYDLWQEVYRVEIRTPQRDDAVMLDELDEVMRRCLVVRDVAVGTEGRYRSHPAGRVYFAVLVEFNPLSPDTVQRIRRWIARPSGTGIQGNAFFGTFVSLFVNRRLGEAERVIRFRSQPVAVP